LLSSTSTAKVQRPQLPAEGAHLSVPGPEERRRLPPANLHPLKLDPAKIPQTRLQLPGQWKTVPSGRRAWVGSQR
jgi:hypothetical protein